MNPKVFLFMFLIEVVTVNLVDGYLEAKVPNNAFDSSFYEDALDPELCDEQIRLIRRNALLSILFADAGIRTPRGILLGNNVDMGNYHQCLGINLELENSVLQGKYCMIRVPMSQSFEFPEWPQLPELPNFDPNLLRLDNETIILYEELNNAKAALRALSGDIKNDRTAEPGNPLSALAFNLAVCIPKPCSTQQAITSLLFNITEIGFEYTDDFCRLPDDKPWVPGDYVFIVIFAVLGLLTLASTSYDLWHTFFMKRDPRSASVIGRSFSVYTNGRRLMTFTSGRGTLECLDGIRSLSMAWVILGHVYTIVQYWANPIDGFTWSATYASIWVGGAHVAVDTFFALSGLLVVYTTAGKLSEVQLLKNIHLFYLNRLLRMFPLLAAAVLIESTYLFRITDGPVWAPVARHAENCRANWWSTLLHIQNYAAPGAMCLIQTWYLAIDVQLHILSPAVLLFVLSGNKKLAWGGLIAALLGIMISSTTYNVIKEFPSAMGAPGRPEAVASYVNNYYLNTLTRASPFVVGMVFGYLIHLSKETKLKMNKVQVTILWVVTFSISTCVMYTNYPIVQSDWSNQTLDTLYNSFIRPCWVFAVCLMIFACVNGYGGPINWFLSLSIWKLPSRISYAMYLYHYMIILVVHQAAVAPIRFSVAGMTFQYLAFYALTFVVSFFLTVVLDSPFSTLFKLVLGPGPKKPRLQDTADAEMDKQNGKQV